MKKGILIVLCAFSFYSCSSLYQSVQNQSFSHRISTSKKRIPLQKKTNLSPGQYVYSPTHTQVNSPGMGMIWPSGRHQWMNQQ